MRQPLSQTRSTRRAKSRGIGLIEVLIALLVIVVGLLGLASLTTSSIRFADESDLRSSAATLAYDITDRIRVNPSARSSYLTKFADQPAEGSDCRSSSCEASDLAAWDLADWKRNLNSLLPTGEGQISAIAGSTELQIDIRWAEREQKRSYQIKVAP